MDKTELKSLLHAVARETDSFIDNHQIALQSILDRGDVWEIMNWLYDYAEITIMPACPIFPEDDEDVLHQFETHGFTKCDLAVTSPSLEEEARMVIALSVPKLTDDSERDPASVMTWVREMRAKRFAPENRIKDYLPDNM